MKNLLTSKFLFTSLLLFSLLSCGKTNECNDCGGNLLDGYIFMEVTADDLAQYEGLALLEGVDVGVCIRVKISGEEINLQTVEVVDECCCE